MILHLHTLLRIIKGRYYINQKPFILYHFYLRVLFSQGGEQINEESGNRNFKERKVKLKVLLRENIYILTHVIPVASNIYLAMFLEKKQNGPNS